MLQLGKYNLHQTFQQVTDPQAAAAEECNVFVATRKDMEMSHVGAIEI